ncbi:3-hydroxyacyl-CoA dehydrogenase [Leisingera sp. M658]|nr:3-hydroxyacyl-CoA dehydrogenase NAD-binding domain-containing protein [Leisingera sp. M658]UWQ73291.1 3-hydroxyacyl-CoA dehydrogenase [Leisingera sp. M658]
MSSTRRTARSRTSGEYLLVVLLIVASSYSGVEASGKPGAVQSASETLVALGWVDAGDDSRLSFTDDPADAVSGADIIQESVPERLEIKHDLYRWIEPCLKDSAIIGSSTSGLKLSEMQAGFADPGRFILAHPFNPPHLIPLVELMDNDKTDPGVLQAAIWRETIHLAMEGVASVEDIDKAVAYGPGLRWAAMGPNAMLHLGGGEGGIRAFCKHLGGPFQSWWDDLGTPRITPDAVDTLETGVNAALENTSLAKLAQKRDALVLKYLLTARKT